MDPRRLRRELGRLEKRLGARVDVEIAVSNTSGGNGMTRDQARMLVERARAVLGGEIKEGPFWHRLNSGGINVIACHDQPAGVARSWAWIEVAPRAR